MTDQIDDIGTIRNPNQNKKQDILGLYVEYLTPKVKSTAYRYLVFCQKRARTAGKEFVVVTNDPVIQSLIISVGGKLGKSWETCQFFLGLHISNKVFESQYLQSIHDVLNCESRFINIPYAPLGIGRNFDLKDYKEKHLEHW